ncbi:class I SAM-dependent methyltransferase [Streptomyces scopuliridis]|nr:class I SAM-dependent methyltransferase [Streptomyces scopuliridis]WSB35389.1 class I SAM-dependent methyltransferase [Streptomyces scopuliridis]WSB99633.1 class I SAM-dependent methyltransferase [Streptomyces scopuliridis]WSC06668.1 class I SAM-dependent methyltransferase [Streptomyces scopuliridis]
MGSDEDALLAEQMAYYRAGAAEYDRPYAEREDLRELQEVLAAADDLPIAGDVLELACGTGRWTPMLAARARSVTAVDASAEVLALARARTESPGVRFVQADVFEWRPPRRYDTVFFAFWLSHVPPARLPGFWNAVAAALAPGGRAVFIDDGPAEAAREDVLADLPVPAAVRRLDDGSQYRIVKVFHDARTLTDDLTGMGWSAHIRPVVAGNFIVGIAEPPAVPV